jgi:ATP-dependent DNA helicase HFM1/MER3
LVKTDINCVCYIKCKLKQITFFICGWSVYANALKLHTQVNGHESLEEIMAIVASCHEFSGMKLRASEKKTLNLLNKARDHECIRFPLPTRIMTTEMKINCLIQAFLGCLPIHEPSLKQDVLRIMWVGKRVTSALVQYLLQHPHYQALVSAITLAKCFHCKLWENSPHMSRQLKGIGTALSSLLVASNKTSFQSIIEANPRDLESILNRPPPTGDKLIAEVNHLPHFELRTESETSLSVTQVDISVEMTNRAVIQEHNAAGENHWLFLLVGDSNNKCIYKQRFKDTCLLKDMKRKVEIKDPPSVNEVYVKLISEQWVGLDVHSSIKLQQPREAMTLKAKNSIEKYLKKQGLNYTSLSSKWSNPQTTKRAKSSVVDQIKDMSEKRLGNTLSMSPTKLTLDKYAYIPAKKPKLHPLLDQPKSMEDEGIDALSQFSIPENCSTEQVNPEMNFRQIKSKLTTDEQVYSPHKSSKAGNSEQDIMPTQADDKIRTLLKFQSTNLLEGPEMQLNHCRVTKCNKDPDEQKTVVLQHTGTGHSDGTQHSPTLNDGKRGPTHEVLTPQQPNESAQKEASHYETDLKLTEPSTSKMNENYHQPFKQNVKLHKDSTLQDKHLKKDEINEGFIPRIETLKSQLEYPETKTSAIVNSQLPYNLHDSLMEGCSSEESKTNKFSFQTRKSSVHEDTTPASTLLLDADYNLCKKYLKTQILRRNMPTCDNNLSLQEKLTVSSNDTQSENTGSDGKHNGKNDSAIVCDNRTAHTSCSPMNRQQTVTSINQNSLSLHTKERIPVRKKLVFEKTLPKHYYPIFMKSLEYDTNETTQRYSSMCDQLKEASSEPTPRPLMIETVTMNETLSDPGEKVMCSFNTETAPSENVITRVKKLHPCPKKEANFYTPVQIKNKRSALLQQSSEVETKDSLTSENGLQVQEENNIKNKKVDTESQPRNDQVLPEFDLVKDLDSLLNDMPGEENGKFKCANKSKKCNDSFMANIPTLSKHSAQNKSVGHTIPHNSSRRNDSKYEPILSLLLKDVSRREAMPYSSRVKAYEESETNVHSQLLSPEFKFEPKSQGARSKVTLSQLTQKLSGHHSTVMLNKNSDNTFPLSKSAQSKNCNGKHIQDQLKYPPSDQKGFTKIMCGSDTVPGDTNKIFNENETYKRRNDVRAVINIPVQQPSLSTQRKSYSNTCEFEDLSCTQPWTLPVEETASKFHPTKCVPGNVQNSSILNSKWQKFEMSPIHSADSPDYY